MTIGNRGIAILLAESHRAAHDRILELLDRHDRKVIDLDALPLLEAPEMTDTTIERMAPAPRKSTVVRDEKPPRYSRPWPSKNTKKPGPKPMDCCGARMSEQAKKINGARIHYRRCRTCGKNNFAESFAAFQAKQSA